MRQKDLRAAEKDPMAQTTETRNSVSAAGSEDVTARTADSTLVDLSIIIVNYNVKEFLQQALLSLRKALEPFSHEIFVVDNASDDGSAVMIRREFPEVILISNDENLGFAVANNMALRRARGRYLVLLNPDTITRENTFVTLIDFLEKHPRTGMVGCKVLNPDGTLQLACRRSYPTPWVAVTRLTGLSYLFPKSRLFGQYNLTYLPENETSRVDAISGSFMMMRRETFEQVGLLDEDFFLYGEDLDWCLRTAEAGWDIHYVPDTQIVHFKGESSKRSRLDSLLVFYKSMALFVKKHLRKRYFFVTYYFLILAIWLRAALSFAQTAFERLTVPLVDVLIMQGTLALALKIKFGSIDVWLDYLPVNVIYTTVWLLSLYFAGSHGRWKFSFFRATVAALAGFIINSAWTFFFKQYAFSRAVVLLAGGMNIFLLGGWRLLFKLLYLVGLAPFRATIGHMLLERPTLVVGDFAGGEKVVPKLKTRIGDGYEIVGLVSLNESDVGKSYHGLEVITSTDRLKEAIKRRNIKEVVFSTQRIPYDRILALIASCRDSRVNFKLIPSNIDVIIGKASIDDISDVPLVDIDYKLARPVNRVLKRALDIAVSAPILLLGAPVYALLSLVQRDQRIETEVFGVDSVLRISTPARGGWFAKLPWLWYVLRGDLSLVGAVHDQTRQPDLPGEIALKPGLTGLVQVNHHRALTQEEQDKFVLFYLMNYSPLLDLEILFKALFRV